MTLSLPPFTKAVKWLIIINTAIYFGLLLLRLGAADLANTIEFWGSLIPAKVMHGFIYQLVTYAFLHDPHSITHILFNMLVLWMFGSQIEMDFGTRQFVEFYLWCVVGAALVTIAVSYAPFIGGDPTVPTIGASGGLFGIYAAFGMLHAEQEIMLFPIPISMKAKYFVWILVAATVAFALAQAGSRSASVAYTAHLGGLLFGYLYLKFLPRRGLRLLFSERYYGVRNSYYRWKRKRAARKFEVYMRQHKREDYFDEYGNFKDPDSRKDDDKGNGESSGGGWVN
jgi:membrane associated rhomboid family serine protease